MKLSRVYGFLIIASVLVGVSILSNVFANLQRKTPTPIVAHQVASNAAVKAANSQDDNDSQSSHATTISKTRTTNSSSDSDSSQSTTSDNSNDTPVQSPPPAPSASPTPSPVPTPCALPCPLTSADKPCSAALCRPIPIDPTPMPPINGCNQCDSTPGHPFICPMIVCMAIPN